MEAPSPDGPHISQLEFIPGQSVAGCPVKVRFRFEAPDGEIVRATAGWRLARGRTVDAGYSVLAVTKLFSGQTSGEITAPLTLNRHGTYWYYVQVEDRAGRRSNVLQGAIVVDANWSAAPPTCADID